MTGFILVMAMIFLAVGLLTYTVVPLVTGKAVALQQKRTQRFASKMERILMKSDIQKLSRIYFFAPLVLGAGGYFLFPLEWRFLGVVLGVVVGFLFPSLYIQFLVKKRKKKFDNQLIDSLLIMSSSFRGGLSLIQAMEAIVEEMSDPIDQEFGTVLSENKMGVSLEEALNHLYERMPSPALQQTITAILLARETGGNLPAIFMRIVNTIREHKKIEQNLATLTLQGKIQGVVMSLLPVAFAFVVYTTNPHFLKNMIHTEMGQRMLTYAFISECIGAFLIWKISTFKNY